MTANEYNISEQLPGGVTLTNEPYKTLRVVAVQELIGVLLLENRTQKSEFVGTVLHVVQT